MTVELVNISIGTKVILQAIDSLFLTLENHKLILENSIKNFSTLTGNTTIIINIEEYDLTVEIFVKDLYDENDNLIKHANIISTDLQVEFLPPMDYVEPKPEDWPLSEDWPLPHGIYIKQEISKQSSSDGNKRYILSNGKEIVIQHKRFNNIQIKNNASKRDDKDDSSDRSEKFVPFSGKGYSLR